MKHSTGGIQPGEMDPAGIAWVAQYYIVRIPGGSAARIYTQVVMRSTAVGSLELQSIGL